MPSAMLVLVGAALASAVPSLVSNNALSNGKNGHNAHAARKDQHAAAAAAAHKRLLDVKLLSEKLTGHLISPEKSQQYKPADYYAAGFSAAKHQNGELLKALEVCAEAEQKLYHASNNASAMHSSAQTLAGIYAAKSLKYTTAENALAAKGAEFATKKAAATWAALTSDSPSTDFDALISTLGELQDLAEASATHKGEKDESYKGLITAKLDYANAAESATTFDAYVTTNETQREEVCAMATKLAESSPAAAAPVAAAAAVPVAAVSTSTEAPAEEAPAEEAPAEEVPTKLNLRKVPASSSSTAARATTVPTSASSSATTASQKRR